MSVENRVRPTYETVVVDPEIRHQRPRTRHVRKVDHQLRLLIINRERELKIRLMNEGRCDERLRFQEYFVYYESIRNLHASQTLSWSWNWNT